jgi:hypothetical protein
LWARLRTKDNRSVLINAPVSDIPARTRLCDPGTLADIRGIILEIICNEQKIVPLLTIFFY